MLDTPVDKVPMATILIPDKQIALTTAHMYFLLTDFHLSPKCLEKTLTTTPLSIPDSMAISDSWEERMWQYKHCFLENLTKSWQSFEHNLLLAQQAFKEEMQIFIQHCKVLQESHLLHPSVYTQHNRAKQLDRNPN